MTTTDEFQKVPNFFFSKEKDEKKYQSNPRYTSFIQTHFTAGDIEQFDMYRDPTNGSNPNPYFDKSLNVWSEEIIGENLDWKKYSNLTTESIDETFLYIFEKFKKGVFVKIKDNKLDVFLPFSKHNYINEWSNRIKVNNSFRDITEFLIYASKIQGYRIKPEQINSHVNKWYANNCLIRSEFPTGENDRCIPNLKDLLLTLCEQRIVPDIELFFNRRDFPLIKRDDTEPYEHIFNSEKFPLISHRYKKYCPILSMVTTNTNADIPFPTMEDWARVSHQEHSKLFAPDFKEYKCNFITNWKLKKPTAIFRGASTGCGVTIDTNPRLKLASLSKTSPIEDGFPLLDAGITKWNCRPRKIINHEFLEVIDPNNFDFKLSPYLSPEKQSEYKYIINVDGHVSAFRLSFELSMGSVILLQDSKYRIWFRKFLKEYVHYVPIKEDLSNLYEQIRWCRQNDDKCQEIASNAKLFYDTYLTEKGILDYVQLLFFNIKNVTGTYYYNYQNVKDIIYQKQLENISGSNTPIDIKIVYPFKERNINSMGGLEIFLNRHSMPIDQLLNKKEIHKSKDSTIHSCYLDKLLLNTKISKRKCELVNESFIGLNCVNKLLREIPNFKYTFGIDNLVLFTEHIEGVLFSEYIKQCSIEDFIAILKILLLTLSVAQERYGFVHNDLTSWNIIIKKLGKKETFIYQFKDQLFTIETSILPIIIDYDRSHAIVDNIHYGIVNQFSSSTFQDCFCMIINTVHDFSLRKINEKDLSILLYIVNFITETDFYSKKIATFDELSLFLNTNKKYNEIVYKNKCDLESFEPCDYFMYLENLPTSSNITIKNMDGVKVYKDYLYVNPLFYYDIIVSQNNHEHIIEYIDKVEQQVMYIIDDFLVNYIYYVHTVNQIYKIMINLKQFIETKDKNTNDYFIEMRNCNRVIKRLETQMDYKQIKQDSPVCGHFIETNIVGRDKVFCKVCNKEVEKFVYVSKLVISPYYNPNFSLSKYNNHTFSIPSKILTILQGNSDLRNEKLICIRYMVRDTLLYEQPYTIQNEKEFAKKYGSILRNLSSLSVINHNANIKTLQFLSKEIYQKDQLQLELLPEPPLKILDTIKNILILS